MSDLIYSKGYVTIDDGIEDDLYGVTKDVEDDLCAVHKKIADNLPEMFKVRVANLTNGLTAGAPNRLLTEGFKEIYYDEAKNTSFGDQYQQKGNTMYVDDTMQTQILHYLRGIYEKNGKAVSAEPVDPKKIAEARAKKIKAMLKAQAAVVAAMQDFNASDRSLVIEAAQSILNAR